MKSEEWKVRVRWTGSITGTKAGAMVVATTSDTEKIAAGEWAAKHMVQSAPGWTTAVELRVVPGEGAAARWQWAISTVVASMIMAAHRTAMILVHDDCVVGMLLTCST